MSHLDEHMDERGKIESILRKIPGFAGYLDRENRRSSDQLARQWITERLQGAKGGLDEYSRRLANAAKIDELPEIDRLRGRLDRFISRIRGAPAGYSGFFDLVQVDEDRLEEVYEHDLWLMDEADKLAAKLEEVKDRDESPSQISAGLLGQIEQLNEKLDQRQALLKGFEVD